MTIAGYTATETLQQDSEFILQRARCDENQQPVLLLVPVAPHPAPSIVARIEHNHDLRQELLSGFAAQPLALLRQDVRPVLCLADPGGQPATNLPGQPIGACLEAAVAIADALARMHGAGLVHKDIKPANILFDRNRGLAWLLGFGFATRLLRQHQAPHPVEVIVGSFPYMAPEQTGRMNRSVDSRSDLYAFGVTLYELLAGQLPFTAASPMEWIHCHIARPPVPLERHLPDIPPTLAALVMKLLEKTAEARYQTAAGVAADLRRCLDQWQAAGTIGAFDLGQQDSSGTLSIIEHLYGREAEVALLQHAFDNVVAHGAAELVLVSGYSGVGKSALVNELHKSILQTQGIFVSGKIDQYKRDIPYATLAHAFETLVRQTLGKPQAELDYWREALLAALGRNGRLVAQLIPELELVIGPQPALPPLPPLEAQNRFQTVFRDFVGVFARPGHPLVLFLDDLQWMDSASLQVFEFLITHDDVRHLLMIGSFRSNEIGLAHPLRLAMDRIHKAGALVRDIVLAPLTQSDVELLVADALQLKRSVVAPLAAMTYAKTGGNPFFTIQFLRALHDERLLSFDADFRSWQWDLKGIEAQGYSDNVVDLMVDKLERLPRPTQAALKQLACLGNHAELSLLALAQSQERRQCMTEVWDALKAELLILDGSTLRFAHDRIQEAAYSLIPQQERAQTHLHIGRLLVQALGGAAHGERVFDVVNHLNHGAALIVDPEERALLARLNFQAGRRARAAVAYDSARTYLLLAASLQRADAWQAEHDTTFALHLDLAECEYLGGNLEQADGLFRQLLERATTRLERTGVHQSRMRLLMVAGRYHESLDVTLEALRLYGMEYPASDDDVTAILMAELAAVADHLGGRGVAGLDSGPLVQDPEIEALQGLLSEAMPCTYIARPSLFPLMAVQGVNLSLRHGNSASSCGTYNCYGILLAAFGDTAGACEYSEMAMRLNARLEDRWLEGTLALQHGAHIGFWRKPFSACLPYLERAFIACQDVGNLVFAGYATMHALWLRVEAGKPLAEALQVAEKYAAFARQCRNDVVAQTLGSENHWLRRFCGIASEHDFDDADCVARLTAAGALNCVAVHLVLKEIAAFSFGQMDVAREASQQAEEILRQISSTPYEAAHHFYRVLILLDGYGEATPEAQAAGRAALEAALPKMRSWAESCPANFEHRLSLVLAEQARVEGRTLDAEAAYERAIDGAREHGLLHFEALASEQAGRFQLGRGYPTIARAYLRQARACYLSWGAAGKARQLEAAYPEMIRTVGGNQAATRIEHLDLSTVLRASQAVSGEIVLDKLVETLLRIALEHAGAGRGLLILSDRIEAEARTGALNIHVTFVRAAPRPGDLPGSVLQYALRTRSTVILDDAASSELFGHDAYIAHSDVKSVLALPLLKQGQLVGVLYLENSLTAGAFTPDRIAILELLASQAAISLENAALYSVLEHKVEARTQALSQKNNELNETLAELNKTLSALQQTQRQLVQAEKLAALGGLVAGVAHEINTPVGIGVTAASTMMESVQGISALFERGGMKKAQLRDFLEDAKNASQIILGNLSRAASLIQNFKEIAVEQSDENRYRFNIALQIEQVLGELRPKLRAAGVVCEMDCPADIEFDSNAAAFSQIIANLVGNTLAHAYQPGQGGRIRLSVRAEDHCLQMQFSDDGVGIPVELLEKIYDPFFTTNRGNGRAGLGLHIVYNLVTQTFRGNIECRSTPGKGCLFAMTLQMD